jgi:putative glutamine amidotransferase
MPRPLIGVTTSVSIDQHPERAYVNTSYLRAVQEAGGVPVLLPPQFDAASRQALWHRIDGLLLTGGGDIDPSRFGAERHPTVIEVSPARDALEIGLTVSAIEEAVPLFAICRGVQVLNVALGGTLVQDIVSERPGALDHDPEAPRSARVHDVVLEHDSALARILGATSLRVNSIHHQAIDRVAESLRVTARAPDGIIEGVEGSDAEWWVVGVQWHPEELIADPEPWDRALLAALVDRARASSSASASRREPVA